MKIYPDRLHRLRKERRLSRAELARRSHVSERTIQRLENESERTGTNRKDTLEYLAKALGVEEGVLTGDSPFPETDKTPEPERVQIGAQVAPKARLGYDLIKRRYGVSTTEILNMAPLFFTLLAEGSLAWRREKLQEAGEAIGRLDQMGEEAGHSLFSGATTVALNAIMAEDESREEKSHFRHDKMSHFRRVKVSLFRHDRDSNVGSYPAAALLSSSFIGALRTPALRLVLSR